MTSLRQDYMKRLSEVSEGRAQVIVSGRCEDEKAYRQAVGFLEGVQAARYEFEEVWNAMNSED